RRRSLRRDADDHDPVLDLGRIHSEPGPRRAVDAAQFAQVIEDRFKEVDRHNHVDMFALAAALTLKLKRADADQFAAFRNQSGAPPIGMRGISEQRFVEQIFPIAGKLLSGRDLARDGAGASTGTAQYYP